LTRRYDIEDPMENRRLVPVTWRVMRPTWRTCPSGGSITSSNQSLSVDFYGCSGTFGNGV